MSLTPSQAVPVIQIAVAAGSITTSYANVGNFTVPLVSYYVVSTLDAPVLLSFDGSSDYLAVPAGDTQPVFMPFNMRANNTFLKPSTFFAKSVGTASSGNLYICGFSAVVI